MSAGFIATVTVACVLFVVFMVLRLTVATKSERGGVVAMFAKTAASLGFISIAVAGLYEGASRAALFVLFGLVFGLIGDMVLDLKVVYLEKPELRRCVFLRESSQTAESSACPWRSRR